MGLNQGLTPLEHIWLTTPNHGFCMHIPFLFTYPLIDLNFRVKLYYFSDQVNKIWLKTVNKTKKLTYAQNIYSSFYINFSSLIFFCELRNEIVVRKQIIFDMYKVMKLHS